MILNPIIKSYTPEFITMPPFKKKLILLTVFYKSTLTLSVAISAMMAVLGIFNIPAMLAGFGLCFFTGGTVVTLLYKEMSKKEEYYFYYNQGLTKSSLIITCFTGNLFVGISIIVLAQYA